MARELGRLIASGRTADVHEWGTGRVLKLFREGMDLAVIRREHSIAVAVHKAGAPSPEAGEIVSMGARYGIEYERIDGVSLPDAMRADPSKLHYYADLMADTHLRVNGIGYVGGLPLQHTMLEERLRAETSLDPETKERVSDRLNELAPGMNLCHGDFHPENITLREDEAIVLDWTVASYGNPSGDLAQTMVIMNGYLETMRSRPLEAGALRQFIQRYLFRYQQSSRVPVDRYRDWIPVVAAARLGEGIKEQEDWLVAQVGSTLSKPPE